MPPPQFTLRALLVAMLVVGAFFAGAEWGNQSGRKRQRQEDEVAAAAAAALAAKDAERLRKYGHLVRQAETRARERERERRKAERLANERVDVGTPPWVEHRRREAAERTATTPNSSPH